MAQYESNSEITSHTIRNFFAPSVAEITLFLLLSIVLLVVFNAGSIIQRLSNNYIGSPEHLKTSFTTLGNGFSSSFSTALGGRLGQILLWSFIGALTYLGLWLAKNVLYSFENDVISDQYLHPSSYSRAGYWGSSLSLKVFLFALVLVLAGYVFVVVRAVLPAVAALAGSAADNFTWSKSPPYMLFCVLGTALVLYLGVLLFRLVAHLWKLL